MLDRIDEEVLSQVSDLHKIKQGAYNIRKNGKREDYKSTKNIQIEKLEKEEGLRVIIRKQTKNESVHIPVILSAAGMIDSVKNEFIIEDGAEVTIVAGCGIHSGSNKGQAHSGNHIFFVGKNAKVNYIEKHYGQGENNKREMNTITQIMLETGSYMKIETVQIEGISKAYKQTIAKIGDNAKLELSERIKTSGTDKAVSEFMIELNGKNSAAHISSRAVCQDNSEQLFVSKLCGNNASYGRTECDAIIAGNGKVIAKPEIEANHPDASLVHEASVGKISGEELTKLLTLGLTEKQAEETLLKGFLK